MSGKAQSASEIRDWVQAIVVVAGVLAGVWEFVFKEIVLPASAPINLSTDINVREAGSKGPNDDKSQSQFEAIELSVTAKNPSTRNVYLLTNCWYAQGETISTSNQPSGDWAANMTQQIASNAPMNQGAFYGLDKVPVIAAAEVFPEDEVLHPNETISTSMVFFVPQNTFDVVRVHVHLPTTAVYAAAEQVWTVSPVNGCVGHTYRKKNGVRGAEITDLLAAYLDRNLQLQAANSVRELSLWQYRSH